MRKKFVSLFARTGIIVCISIPCLIIFYAGVWVASTKGILGEVPLGYYADFFVVKHAIEAAECVKSSASGRHEEVFALESFHFTVRTRSGRLVRLFFQNDQNVSRVCSAPKGLLVVSPGNWENRDQLYNIDSIIEHFAEKGIRTPSMLDILCNIDELVPLLQANYYNHEIPIVTQHERNHTRDFRAYLRLQVVDEQLGSGGFEIPPD